MDASLQEGLSAILQEMSPANLGGDLSLQVARLSESHVQMALSFIK